MQTRSYNYGSGYKRSTLLEAKRIYFPREDLTAPRYLILKKECPEDYEKLIGCLKVNADHPEKCEPIKIETFICGREGFRKANADINYVY